jgi:hypothetical protein
MFPDGFLTRRAAVGLMFAALGLTALPRLALADDALAFAQSLYALPNLWGDVTTDDAAIAKYLAPELAALTKENYANPDPDAALDYDPLVQAQDFSDVKTKFTVKSETATAATIEVAIDNLDASTTVTLDLAKAADGWRLANVQGPDGPSLADELKQLNTNTGGD